ncbi:MAG TPA: peptidoglycan-binding domain-containing protein, partial [Lamprocystis sp. (in: g-proteobacteria)]|nr:peptidoglycan-binding domain-containing protein [Lamprocystis sp. (in: g-proteobacteria)]
LRVKDADGGRRYAVLGALDETHGTLDLSAGAELVPVAGIESNWSGDYTVVWQPPPTGASVIGPGAAGESVRWLRQRLSATPGIDLADNGSGQFDAALGATLRSFQAARGLVPDGIAGPRTLVQLDNAVATSDIPHLMTPPLAAAAAAQAATAQVGTQSGRPSPP